MIKQIGTYVAATFTLIFLSGGACYEFPKTITSKGLSASSILPEYIIYESNSDRKKLCSFNMVKPSFLLNSLRIVQLIPPAKLTFQGKPVNLDQSTGFPCQHQIGEFVLTDDRGEKRIDKYNFQQVKLPTEKIVADRSQDLRIKLLNVAYPQNTDFQISIDVTGQETYKSAVRSFSEKYRSEIVGDLRPLFESDSQTLVIPSNVLKNIKGKIAKLDLRTEVQLFTKYPDEASRFNSFRYNYFIPPISIELK